MFKHIAHESHRAAVETIDRKGNRSTLGTMAFCRVYEDGGMPKGSTAAGLQSLAVLAPNKRNPDKLQAKQAYLLPWVIERYVDLPLYRDGQLIGRHKGFEPIHSEVTQERAKAWLERNPVKGKTRVIKRENMGKKS